MTIQEMAQVLIDITAEDAAALGSVAEAESAAFEAYADRYRVELIAGCKGCHTTA
jgi:hypothetical protein